MVSTTTLMNHTAQRPSPCFDNSYPGMLFLITFEECCLLLLAGHKSISGIVVVAGLICNMYELLDIRMMRLLADPM